MERKTVIINLDLEKTRGVGYVLEATADANEQRAEC
jgi:hypothetical protein